MYSYFITLVENFNFDIWYILAFYKLKIQRIRKSQNPYQNIILITEGKKSFIY